jgi:DNA segregation ATPase FtsK/SpoIIIE-like protein
MAARVKAKSKSKSPAARGVRGKGTVRKVSQAEHVAVSFAARLLRELALLGCLGLVVFCMVSVVTVFLVEEAGVALRVAPYVGRIGKGLGHLLVGLSGGASALFTAMLAGYILALWNRADKISSLGILKESTRIGLLMVVLSAFGWIVAGVAGGGAIGGLIGEPLHRGVGTLGAVIFSGLLFVFLVPSQIIVECAGRVAACVSLLIFGGAGLFSSIVRGVRDTIQAVLFRGLLRGAVAYVINLQKKFGTWRRNKQAVANKNKSTVPSSNKVGITAELKNLPTKKSVASHNVVASIGEHSSPEVVMPQISNRKTEWKEYETQFKDYKPPPFDLLALPKVTSFKVASEHYDALSATITSKLADFNVSGRVTRVHPGPVITLFEFEPAPGVKVGKIASLVDDLAMSLRARSIRILAPLPGQGTVGIEIPNNHRSTVFMRDVLESEVFMEAKSCLAVPLGQDTKGHPVVTDIGVMPHLLIAGATGTGKSVCINSLLMGLLFRASPKELGLILIDPKILELSIYEDVPHLRVPVVTVAKQARAVLQWAVAEMERRYRLMQKLSVRNVDGFNQALADGKWPASMREEFETFPPLQKIVIVIDELADLMIQVGREIEELITRLAQKARAAGIHLIVATQRPSVDVITGLIKANFPARLSFRVSSRVDSRTILDASGAERLLGRGDMLFLEPGTHTPRRIHGAYVSDEEVASVVDHLKQLSEPRYDPQILELCERALEDDDGSGVDELELQEYDPMYDKAVQLVVSKGQASTSMVQRAFRIGYNRAARIIDIMEREGVVGPMDGSKPRQVLVGNIEQ